MIIFESIKISNAPNVSQKYISFSLDQKINYLSTENNSFNATLIELMLGYIKPDQGSIIIDDINLGVLSQSEKNNLIKNNFGLIPKINDFLDYKLMYYLEYVLSFFYSSKKKINNIISNINLFNQKSYMKISNITNKTKELIIAILMAICPKRYVVYNDDQSFFLNKNSLVSFQKIVQEYEITKKKYFIVGINCIDSSDEFLTININPSTKFAKLSERIAIIDDRKENNIQPKGNTFLSVPSLMVFFKKEWLSLLFFLLISFFLIMIIGIFASKEILNVMIINTVIEIIVILTLELISFLFINLMVQRNKDFFFYLSLNTLKYKSIFIFLTIFIFITWLITTILGLLSGILVTFLTSNFKIDFVFLVVFMVINLIINLIIANGVYLFSIRRIFKNTNEIEY